MKNFYSSKHIFITGATGYLGDSVLRALSGYASTIKVLTTDIRDENIWPDLLKDVDIVFHFAAQTSTYVANDDPVNDIAVNVLPVAALLKACLKYDLRPDIIFSGTVTQVGLTEETPVNESIKDFPVTIYDIHKLTVEHYLRYYTHQMGGRAVTLRLSNIYGPGSNTSRGDRGILNQMIEKALRGQVLTVYGDGNFVRDYVFIDDIVQSFLAAGVCLDSLKGNHYVIGSGIGHTVADMVQMVAQEVEKHTGEPVTVEHTPIPKGLSSIEFRNFIADSSAFQYLTGWKPQVGLREGICKTMIATQGFIRGKKGG